MILLRLPKLVWMGKVESYQVTLEKQLSISRSNSLLFRLAEDGIYALGKPHMRSIPSLRFFFPVSFETVPMFVWPTMALSRRFKEFCRALSLSTLLYSRRSIVPAGGGSSSSTFQIFREAGHLWVLLWPPIYPLGRFPSLRYVQGSAPTGIFEGGCRPLPQSSLSFPFYFL